MLLLIYHYTEINNKNMYYKIFRFITNENINTFPTTSKMKVHFLFSNDNELLLITCVLV